MVKIPPGNEITHKSVRCFYEEGKVKRYFYCIPGCFRCLIHITRCIDLHIVSTLFYMQEVDNSGNEHFQSICVLRGYCAALIT